MPQPTLASDLYINVCGQCIDHRDTHAVQTTGNRIALPAELPAGVQDGEHHLNGGLAFGCHDVDRDTAAVVDDTHPAVSQEGHVDVVAMTG